MSLWKWSRRNSSKGPAAQSALQDVTTVHTISGNVIRIGFSNAWMLMIAAFTPSVAFSAEPEPISIINRTSRIDGRTVFLSGARGLPIPASPGQSEKPAITRRQFFNSYGRLFGVKDAGSELVASAPQVDDLAQIHVTYNQVFNGIPVFTGILKVHENAQGEVVAANGHFHSIDPKFDVTPLLTKQDATKAVSAQTESPGPTVNKCELVIVDPGWYGDPPIGPHLAYYVILSDSSIGLEDAFFIDAMTGKILDRWTLIENILQRVIYDGVGARDLPGVVARIEGDQPVLSPEDVNRGYDFIDDTYGYYFRAFGRDGLDGFGSRIRTTVNSTAPGCPNAFWSDVRKQTVFCDGTVSDDIVAHEFTHGVTHFTAQLLYQNQSGQLNESFSDVFGELIDLFNGNAAFLADTTHYQWPQTLSGTGHDLPNLRRGDSCSIPPDYAGGVRWLFAEDASVFGGLLRDMWNPPCMGHPDRANSPLETCDPFDSGGVHSGSGIPNHAFAMLTDGKTFNGFTVRGIGPIKSGAVWYRALTMYMPIAPDFLDAYYAFNQAASDLIGKFLKDPRTGFPSNSMFTADDAAQVDLALRAVEMDTPGRCGQAVALLLPNPPPSCAQSRTIYFDDFENGAPGWTVENSQPPSPYDWVLSSVPLPLQRSGHVWYCDDPDVGDCHDNDESGLHSLISPEIKLQGDLRSPRIRFTHHFATEGGFDGGQVKIRVNGSAWFLIPGSAFLFNPYTGPLNRVNQGSTNPLAGTEGWSGVSGKFGTSVAAIERFARPGDTVQLRFDFGKNGCTGVQGWYVDDFEVYDCTDCDRNGRGDDNDLIFSLVLEPAGPVGKDTPVSFDLTKLPLAGDDVSMRVSASGDLSKAAIDEYLEVSLDHVSIGRVFDGSGNDCADVPDIDDLTIDRDVFNAAIQDGHAKLTFVGNDEVNPTLCDGTSYVRPVLTYRTAVPDDNHNNISDMCENCGIARSPTAAADATSANRYLVINSTNPNRITAIFVTPVGAASEEKSVWQGEWVDQPVFQPEPRDIEGPLLTYASLTCEPAFVNWSLLGEIRISGEMLVPGKLYSVRELDVACLPPDGVIDFSRLEPNLSLPNELPTTAIWGDISSASKAGVADGKVDMIDLTAILDCFGLLSRAVQTYQADLAPAKPDHIVDIRDIAAELDALHGVPLSGSNGPLCPIPSPRVRRNRH
ncbi:MAG: M4 family metallopeptidase [Planctomycetes bacterium]|nr:M4 family metallopeptidase [Planctomycetota bacterium]MBI3835760.1 M4 family metallopeptidase [Planctomycetota bacterium]